MEIQTPILTFYLISIELYTMKRLKFWKPTKIDI